MPTDRVLELRIFRVHHGRRAEFIARFEEELVPMLKRHGVEPIHYGPSLHDQDSFFLIRAWPSVEARQAGLDSMFGGAEWLMNQEEQVLGMIDSMDTAMFAADEWLIGALKEAFEDRGADAELAGDDGGQDQRG